MSLIKEIPKALLKHFGYEACRLSDAERRWQARHGLEFDYKCYQSVRALAATSQLSLSESKFLAELVQASDPSRPIIEIGTLYGWSTLVITLFKHPGQKLITVDNYSWNSLGIAPEAHYTATRLRLAEAVEKFNVQQVKMDKDEFYRQYQGTRPSLFFCDADHGYEATKADLEWANKIGADIICGDDYSAEKFPGVVRAVEEMGGAAKVVDGLFLLRSPASAQ
ncbi:MULTISPECIES: class I SAM-dependent methyltransferase [Microcystis]|jgi:hypothetical protein|uniref:Class I SAM-dependent methyltransferase n=1 Tax=Microcystis wesenbergii NRERC-220 TaxID=3068991 RepID=A0ABU3HMG1_9CHRO|nr:class I SAM-dependent methyltransferase [Microcystis wesenbergii]MDT3675750.1 class I SAM-dependent methyltransferase [Microcystis wesenbergii NRERC-220]